MYHTFPKDEDSVALPDSEAPALPLHRRRLSAGRLGALALLIAALLAAGAWRWVGGGTAQADAPPPPTVTVAQPLVRTIVEWDDHVGRFEASRSVEIRPRVSGELVGIHFLDCEVVRRGQLLFTIDPRPFAAALAEARARLAAAESALALARSEYARAARLVDAEAVSQEEVDSLRAAVTSGTAQVAAARAVVRQRALDLEFTRVRAPITGRISDRRIDAGNLVAASESLLTTILALDPIHFSFDAPESLALRAQRDRRQSGSEPARVEIRLQDEADYSWRGRVDFTDNRIDPGSGTLRGRAVVANPDYFLTPGMFGNMRLAASAPREALLVPDSAVQTDQARRIVLVVERDGKVGVRPVELGPRMGSLRAIRSGLSPADRVIVEGVQFARPGTPVNVRVTRVAAGSAAPAASPAAAPPPASQATLAR